MIAVIANTHRDFQSHTHGVSTGSRFEFVYIDRPERVRGLDITAVLDISYGNDRRLQEVKREAYYRLNTCIARTKQKEIRLENENKRLTKELNKIKQNWLCKLGKFLKIF